MYNYDYNFDACLYSKYQGFGKDTWYNCYHPKIVKKRNWLKNLGRWILCFGSKFEMELLQSTDDICVLTRKEKRVNGLCVKNVCKYSIEEKPVL